MKHASEKKFSELRDDTKAEIAELIAKDDYTAFDISEKEVHRDKSDFSKLSKRTKDEIAELVASGEYSPEEGSDPAEGGRIKAIMELRVEEERKSKEFHSRQEQGREEKEREFADTELMKKNLGIHEANLEAEVQRAAGPDAVNKIESVDEIQGEGAAYVSGMLDKVANVVKDETFYKKKGDFIKFEREN